MIFFIFSIGGVCITLLLLAAGIGIGIFMRDSHEREALPLIAQVTTHCAAQLAETTTLAKEARGLSDACVQHQPQLPAHILVGADSVVRASTSLQKQMESLNSLMVVFQQSKNSAPQDQDASPVAEQSGSRRRSRDELDLFQDRGSKPAKTKSALPGRLRLELWQYVAPFDGLVHPLATSFELVHCTASSSDGFSFLSKQPPQTEKLIVAVGSPSDLQFLVAEVLHTQPATMDGETGHLSACLFGQKLPGVYKWDSAQCRIAISASPIPA